MRTSVGPGCGIGRSSIFKTDGSPRRSHTTARMTRELDDLRVTLFGTASLWLAQAHDASRRLAVPKNINVNPSLLVELEGVLVVELQGGVLVFLAQQAIADHQYFDLAAHEAAEGVFGRAHDR